MISFGEQVYSHLTDEVDILTKTPYSKLNPFISMYNTMNENQTEVM